MGCLQPTLRPRHSTGLDDDELEASAVDRARTAEARETILERKLVADICRVGIAPRGVRLPDLDHPVRNGLAGTVEQATREDDRPGISVVDEA